MASYKIATNGDVNTKMGTSLTPTDKCPTKSQLVAAGVSVAGSYGDNQLVRLDHVGKKSLRIATASQGFVLGRQSTETKVKLTYDGDTSEHPLIIKKTTQGVVNWGGLDSVEPYIDSSLYLCHLPQMVTWSPYYLDYQNGLTSNYDSTVLTIGAETSPGSGVFDTDYCNTVTYTAKGSIGGSGQSKLVTGSLDSPSTFIIFKDIQSSSGFAGVGNFGIGNQENPSYLVAYSESNGGVPSSWILDGLRVEYASESYIGSGSIPQLNWYLFGHYMAEYQLSLIGSGGYGASGWDLLSTGSSSIPVDEVASRQYPYGYFAFMDYQYKKIYWLIRFKVKYD